MNRHVLVLASLLVLLAAGAAPARAQSSSQDIVSPLNWSYAALHYLSTIGELTGYPAGYFDVNGAYRLEHGVALKRYEMEQAVARAQVSTWNKLSWQQSQIPYMVADLCHEFNSAPGHNTDPAVDDCQCMWVTAHGLIVPEDYWAYGAVQGLIDAGLIAERPEAPVRFPLGWRDFEAYTTAAREGFAVFTGPAEVVAGLELTVQCLENEFFDPFAAFRAGYQTITDWIAPALDYVTDTGYIEGIQPDYFDITAPHFAKADTMPTMQDCYLASQAFAAKLAAMQAAGEPYPRHLDYLSADLTAICLSAAPAAVEEPAEAGEGEEAAEETKPPRKVRRPSLDDPPFR